MKDLWEKLKNWFRGIIEFLGDTRKELRNVSWPSRKEVTGTTIVVIAACFFFGFFLFVADTVVNFGITRLFNAVAAR